jgi:hypothetical protein
VPIDADKLRHHLRARSRVIDDRARPVASMQPRLELRRVLSKIVKDASQPASAFGAELGRRSRGETGNFDEVLTQWLPGPLVA